MGSWKKFGLLGWGLLLPVYASGGTAPTVAVLPAQCVGTAPDCSRALSEFLASELANSSDFQVIEKAQIDKVLANQAKELSDLYDQGQAVQFGKLLSAKMVLVTMVHKSSTGVDVTSRLVEVETGAVVGSVSVKGGTGSYLSIAKEVARGLLEPKYKCSSQNGGQGAERAFDQNEATYWEAAPGNFQGWLEIAHPGPRRFSHAEFHSPVSPYGSGVPSDFVLEYFDGAKWQVATKATGNMRRTWSEDFIPQTASKWRIQISDVINPDTPIRISEFKLELKEEKENEKK